jgi:hypothetical protein
MSITWKPYTIYGVILGILCLCLASCAGYNLGDLIRVKTPVGIQQSTGLPKTMPLNEAKTQYAAWFEDTKRSGNEWKTQIESGDEVAGLLSQLAMQQLDAVGPTLAGIPVLNASLPVIAGLLGVYLGKRKTDAVRQEKEDSYNKGLEIGSQIAQK